MKLDLDFLCACRTAPHQSWRNPAERVMSIVNLGLAKKQPDVIPAVRDGIEPAKVLLLSIFERLHKYFKSFTSASEEMLREIWSQLKHINPSLAYGEVYRQASLIP